MEQNELQVTQFNYGQLDSPTSEFLKSKEDNMRTIMTNATTQIGKELKEAQDELANNHRGVFEKWYTSLGFKETTVYNLINRYELLSSSKIEEQKLLEELPKSLVYEIAKPSVNQELKESVLNGDITTLKEYKELEKQKKDLESKSQQLEKDKLDLQNKLKIANSRPTESVMVEVEKVIDKTDYTIATKNKELEAKLNQINTEKTNLQTKLQLMTNKADAYAQDSSDYKKMKEDITYLTQQKDDLGRQILAITDISGLVVEIDHFIKDKLAPVRYSKSLTEAKDDEVVIRNLSDMVETVEQWCFEMKKFIPNKINYVEVIV